jgi:hypothetical protein
MGPGGQPPRHTVFRRYTELLAVYHHVWIHGGIFEKMSEGVNLETGEIYTQMLAEDNTRTLTATENRPPRSIRKMELPILPGRNGNKEPAGGGTCVSMPSTTMKLSGRAYTPIALGRTRVTIAFFFVPETTVGPEYEESRKKDADLFLGNTQ